MTKKTKISLLVTLVVLIVGSVLAYYIFVKVEQPANETNQEETSGEVLDQNPSGTAGKLVEIVSENIVSPVINEENNTIKYITKGEGLLYQSSLDGKDKTQKSLCDSV